MPSPLSLPAEVIPIICSYLDRPSLKSLRQTCRAFVNPTTTALFRTISLFPDEPSCDRLENILANPELCTVPRKFYIYTIEEDNDPDKAGDEEEAVLPTRWKYLLPRVHSFVNVQSAVLRLDQCYCADSWPSNYPQTTDFRFRAIDDFFSMLASLKLPVKELGLWNLQVDNPENEQTLEKLSSILPTLQSLRLTVVCEYNAVAPESDIECPEPHQFFYDMPSTWLVPAASSLRHLSLIYRDYFGFWPKLDLRAVHFPHLESLSLGNYTFVNDSQIDWIVSHAATLRELYLDDCAILYDVGISNDHARLADLSIEETELRHYRSRQFFRAWDRRWHHIFATFESRLSQLRKFYMGSSGWHGGAPFEKEHDIVVGLFTNRYLVFYDIYGPSPYMSDHEVCHHYERTAPECDEEDRKALRAILRKLGQPVTETCSLTRPGFPSRHVKDLIGGNGRG